MKKAAALFFCLLLLASFALPSQAEGQRLLYPGTVIQGDSVYLLGVSTQGGAIQATANGKAVSCTALPLQENQVGVTYYCVVSVTSSLSDAQREQQRSGVIALCEALEPKDSIVLVSMGREVSFGEPITDSAACADALDALAHNVFGTNLYEGISTVLSTVSEAEGFRSVVFFTDGCDHSDVVKYTQEQIGRMVQNSGLCVSFLALLASPVTAYASAQVEKLELYAELSLGGVYHAPLLEDGANYINAMENAAREIVNQSEDWTVFQFDAAELPRDEKTVELSVTWTGNGASVTGTAQVDTASLPEPPETEPETEPETVPETTAPPQTEATQADVPEYVPDNDSKTLYYVAIGGAVAVVLIAILLVIISARRAARRRKIRKSRPAASATPDAQANRFVPVMPEEITTRKESEAPKEEIAPAEPEKAEERIPETPAIEEDFRSEELHWTTEAFAPETEISPADAEAIAPINPESPEEVTPAAQEAEEAALPQPEVPEAEIPQEAPTAEIAPENPEAPEKAAPAALEAEETALPQPEVPEAEIPQEAPTAEIAPENPEVPEKAVPAALESVPQKSAEEDFSLEMLYKLLGETVPESEEPPKAEISPAEPEPPKAEPAPAEPSEDAFSMKELYKLLEETAPIKAEPKAKAAQANAEKPKQKAAAEEPMDFEETPAAQQTSSHWPSFFHHQERWIDDVKTREDATPPAAPAPKPAPQARTGVSTCTVRLMPEGNPGGSVYVVMEPNSSRTLGRNQKADIILNKADTCLSGLHFELQWDGRVLYLTDRNSTNGTAITGVRQKPGHWARVESGATIRAGNTRYKVKITKN